MEYNNQIQKNQPNPQKIRQDQKNQNQPKKKAVPPKWWSSGVLLLSFAGFLDSAYLTLEHFLSFGVSCSLVTGCQEVLGSQYADIFGIPVALLGVFYYLAVFLAMVAYIDRKKFMFLKIAVVLPITGFLFTLWFLFAQAVLLQAFCLYCLISAALTTGLFLLSAYYLLRGYRMSVR